MAEQLRAGLMSCGSRPCEPEWRSARDRFSEGDVVRGIVSKVVPFGLLVDLPSTAVQGVVLAPGFPDPASFSRRADSHPIGSTVDLVVLGASEGRLQIDLRLRGRGCDCGA